MRRVSIAAPAFTYDDDDPDGFRAGMFRLGKTVGSAETGMSVYELPPGQSICPYHYEYAEEEWLLVLEGRPTLRRPGGTEPLEPWDVVFFPKGPDGAHGVRNETGETVRVLIQIRPFRSGCQHQALRLLRHSALRAVGRASTSPRR